MHPNNPLTAALLTVGIAALSPAAQAGSMDGILKTAPSAHCQALLINAAGDFIGKNAHRLYLAPRDSRDDYPIISGIIAYHDRHAHITIQASETSGQCSVNIRETAVFADPCTAIRTEVFSKWQLLGQLDANTWILEKNRRVRYPQTAYLSSAINNGSSCLATISSDIRQADLDKAAKDN